MKPTYQDSQTEMRFKMMNLRLDRIQELCASLHDDLCDAHDLCGRGRHPPTPTERAEAAATEAHSLLEAHCQYDWEGAEIILAEVFLKHMPPPK